MTAAVFLSRSLLEWRDATLISAEEAFTRATLDLEHHLSEEFGKAGLITAATRVSDWMKSVADPAVAARIGATSQTQEDQARASLAQIIEAAPDFVRRDGGLGVEGGSAHVVVEVASVGVPMALAATLLVAAPGIAVSTATAWLGLSVVSTVAMPVVIGAVGIGALLVSTGAVRAFGVRRRLDDRQTARLKTALRACILDADGSHLDLFRRAITETCDRLLKGLQNDSADPV